MSETLVISGVSGRYPQADNLEEFWSSLLKGAPLYSIDKTPFAKGMKFISFETDECNETFLIPRMVAQVTESQSFPQKPRQIRCSVFRLF